MNITVPEGTVIIREGVKDMNLYKIESGNVEIYTGYGTNKECILGILSGGSYIGELGFFTQKPSIYTAVTYNDCLIRRIPVVDMKKYLEDHIEDAIKIMKNMADSVYNMSFTLDLMQDDILSMTSNNREKAKDMAKTMTKQIIKYNMGLTRAMGEFNAKV